MYRPRSPQKFYEDQMNYVQNKEEKILNQRMNTDP